MPTSTRRIQFGYVVSGTLWGILFGGLLIPVVGHFLGAPTMIGSAVMGAVVGIVWEKMSKSFVRND